MIDNVVDPAGTVSLNCEICGGTDTSCICPECVCGVQGDPECIRDKHMPVKAWEKSLRQVKEYSREDDPAFRDNLYCSADFWEADEEVRTDKFFDEY